MVQQSARRNIMFKQSKTKHFKKITNNYIYINKYNVQNNNKHITYHIKNLYTEMQKPNGNQRLDLLFCNQGLNLNLYMSNKTHRELSPMFFELLISQHRNNRHSNKPHKERK